MKIERVSGCTNYTIYVDGSDTFHEPDVIVKLLSKRLPKNLWRLLDCIDEDFSDWGDECEQCGDTVLKETWII